MNTTNNLELHKYSSYSSGLYFSPWTINTLRIELPKTSIREITHPRLSRYFVSGILEDQKTKVYLRTSCIVRVEFLHDEEINFPELSFTRKTIGEQLVEVGFPAELKVQYRNSKGSVQRVRVLGLFRGFLVTDSQLSTAIPLAALSIIEIECV